MKVYIIWLVGVILWNYGYPEAKPLLDVLAAIILSFISIGLKKYFKFYLISIDRIKLSSFRSLSPTFSKRPVSLAFGLMPFFL